MKSPAEKYYKVTDWLVIMPTSRLSIKRLPKLVIYLNSRLQTLVSLLSLEKQLEDQKMKN